MIRRARWFWIFLVALLVTMEPAMGAGSWTPLSRTPPISVGLMVWAFLTGLLLLAGAHFSATRFALRAAREAEREEAAK